MSVVISAPADWIESVGELRLPPTTDLRLQHLMDKNTDGILTEVEREELASLVDLSERLSLVRAEALHLLGKSPGQR